MSALSPWESEILRFPGHVPGVLRRGSNVVALVDIYDGLSHVSGGVRGVLTQIDEGDHWVVFDECADGFHGMAVCASTEIALDLQDATGRAHLAWWLQLEHGSGGGSIEDGGFRIDWQPGRWAWARPGEANTGREWFLCSPLQFGSKDDGRSLPDGSSLLRALALGIIARHVASLPIPVQP